MLNPLLILDFGTSFLKGVSFAKIFPASSPRDEEGKVLDFVKVSYHPSGVDLEEKLIKLILTLEEKEKVFFNSVVIGVGEGIGRGKIKKVSFLRKCPSRPISSVEFNKMIESCQKDSFLEVQKEFDQEDLFGELYHPKLVFAEIKKAIIDNVPVLSPVGNPGRVVTLKIINFYLPSNFYEVLEKSFSKLKMKFISFEYIPDIFPSALMLPNNNRKMFVDVGGENTQIFLSGEDGIETVKEFSLGGEFLLEEVSKKLRIKKEILSAIGQGIKKGFFSPRIEKEIEKILYSQYKIWEEKLALTIRQLSDSFSLPKEIYLFGGGSSFLNFNELEKRFANSPFCSIIKTIIPSFFRNIVTDEEQDNFQLTVPLSLCNAVIKGKVKPTRF